MRRHLGILIVSAAAAIASACAGPQSALDTAGRDAAEVSMLFWWMAGGAAVVWLAVVGLGVYCVRAQPSPRGEHLAPKLIVVGGVVVPTVVLAVLLMFGLALVPPAVAPAPEGSLTIAVAGEQWWWRVRYQRPGQAPIELANEIRLPVGRAVDVRLASSNVIHSFWIPSLAGKVDMIPGRLTRLSLEPTRTGLFRGACAEYCGTAHAFMAFPVVVLDEDAFASWLEAQAAPAAAPSEPLAARGQELFLANGCSACHTIRGTRARGVIGPDLTHVGSRLSLAAGALPNEADDFFRWIARSTHVKPGAHMPAFGMLVAEDLRALAAYLDGLQ